MQELRSFTTAQVANLTGIPQRTLEDLRLKGTGPAFLRLGRLKGIRYLESDLLAWMRSNRFASAAEASAHDSRKAA